MPNWTRDDGTSDFGTADRQPKPGEVRVVRGGYGLMVVLKYDAMANAAEMLGHGPKRPNGYWFYTDRLSAPVDAAVVLKERAEARARKVDCNSPDCWCRAFVDKPRRP